MLTYFSQRQFKVFKRAEILGRIALEYKTIAVAGTHGKTTITAMVSHLLHQSAVEVNAMVGGIMKTTNRILLHPQNQSFSYRS